MSKYILASFGSQSGSLRLTCKVVKCSNHNKSIILDGDNMIESTFITYLPEPLDEQLLALFNTFIRSEKVDIITKNYTTVCHVILDNIPEEYKWLHQYIITNEQMSNNNQKFVLNCTNILQLMIELCTKDSDFVVVFELPNE